MSLSEDVAELEAEHTALTTQVHQLRAELDQVRATLTPTDSSTSLADRVWARLSEHRSGYCASYANVRVTGLDFLRVIIAQELAREPTS